MRVEIYIKQFLNEIMGYLLVIRQYQYLYIVLTGLRLQTCSTTSRNLRS